MSQGELYPPPMHEALEALALALANAWRRDGAPSGDIRPRQREAVRSMNMKRLVPSALYDNRPHCACRMQRGRRAPCADGEADEGSCKRGHRSQLRGALLTCTVPAQAFIDLVACVGDFEVFEDEMAATRDGKSLARIAVASQDAKAILAAMGEEAVQLPRR